MANVVAFSGLFPNYEKKPKSIVVRFGQCAYEINFAPSVEILLESNYEKKHKYIVVRFGQCAYEINFAPSVEILLFPNYEKKLKSKIWPMCLRNKLCAFSGNFIGI